jgi:spore maturation protein CgeB
MALKNSGYQVDVYNYRTVANEIGYDRMNDEISKLAADFDLIIFCKANGVRAKTIKKCSKVAKTCWYMMDALVHLNNNEFYYEMAKAAGFSVVTTKAVYEALIGRNFSSKKVYHVLQGVNANQFFPINSKKMYDVVFIGQATEKRNEILNKLSEDGIKVKAAGPGFGHEVYGTDFSKLCAQSKILLAINNTDPGEDSFSDRILRYMACKGCVVTEYSKGLEKYFSNGTHCAWPTDGDLSNLIKHYLEHPKMREYMSERGYKYVIENFTWNSVAKQIIEIAEGL